MSGDDQMTTIDGNPAHSTSPTLPEIFKHAATRIPDSIAVVTRTQSHTWEQWRVTADALGCGLQELGVGQGDVVAAQLPNGFEFLALHVAVAMIGGVLLPMSVDSGRADVESLLARIEPKALVIADQWRDRSGVSTGRALQDSVPAIEHLLIAGCSGPAPGSLERLIEDCAGRAPSPVDVRPEHPLVLVPSSGTTSARPKICTHSHGGLLSNARAVIADSAAALVGDTMLSASPFNFLFGLLSVHVSILAGARQAICGAWDRVDFMATMVETSPTVLFAVPTQLHDIVAEARERGGATSPRLRQVRTGGSMVPADLVVAVSELLADEIIVQWGMSEIGAGTCTRPGDPIELVSRSVGRPITGGRVRVTDADDRPCAHGRPGNLQFLSANGCSGYFGDPESTEKALTADGWWRTGDVAAIDADGVVTLHGRLMDVINVGGRKVNALEIERLMADFAATDEVVVVGRHDSRLGEVPVLVCTAGGGRTVSLEAVVAHLLAEGVARYQLPAEVIVVDRLPYTPTGKVARRRVQEIAETKRAASAPPGSGFSGDSDRERLTSALAMVCDLAGRVIGAPVTPDASFGDQGFDSHAGVRLRAELTTMTGLELPDSLIFDCPTPRALARRLLDGDRTPRPDPRTPTRAAHGADDDPLAIVGMSCRLPGDIRSPEQFWALLAAGGEVLSELPGGRGWPVDDLYVPEPTPPGKISSRFGGFLGSVFEFDANFFGISERDARSMDPQQRLLLETVWEALERGGVTTTELRDSDTGVFIGMMASDYAPRWFDSPDSYDGTLGLGTTTSAASGRLSYLLGLHGPALTVDTACSSSLVALHLAAQALRNRETSLAIVGGVTVMSSPANLVEFSRQSLLASDGRCKPFALDADGVGLAEGAGVVLLQRLSDARRHGRRVLAIVRGSAVGQDGASNGMTAPSGSAQEMVIRQALRSAGLTPAEVDVVDAHGTGTPLGDPIEARALLAAYGADRATGQPLWVGSAKSNVGHTQAAAGIVSVIKMVLALQHSTMPRALLAGKPNGAIDWSSGPMRLLTDSVEWPKSERVRRAGVSSFGISGTNSHVLLEEPPAADRRRTADSAGAAAPWLLSAKDPATLQVMAGRLYESLDATPAWSAAEVGNALANGRSLFAHRAAVLPDVDGRHDRGLLAFAKGIPSPHVVSGTALSDSPTVFVFPGHGTHWTAMARQLMSESEVFADAIAECEKAFAPYAPWSLSAVLRGEVSAPALDSDAEVLQPATFAVMVALAALWRSYGVFPDAVVGHSQGEVAAACVAGALSLPDAARIVTARARLIAKVAGRGAMVALAMHRAEVAQRLTRWQGQLCVAVVNGPRSVVVSGDADAIAELLDDARRTGITAKRIPGDIAFHSPHMEGFGAELGSLLHDVRSTVAPIPFYSATTATQVSGDRLDPDYWYRNMRAPVDLDATTRALHRAGYRLFIEVSPHPVLTPAIEQTATELGSDVRVVTSLRRDAGSKSHFLRSLAEAHVHGATVSWQREFGDHRADASCLPTYPFRERRFRLEPRVRTEVRSGERIDEVERRPTALPTRLERRAELVTLILQTVTAVTERDDSSSPAADTDFDEYGLTSLDAIEVRNMLAAAVGVNLPATVVLDNRPPEKLADYLVELPTSTASTAAPADVAESVSERRSPVETQPPPSFETVYRKLCAQGHIEDAWNMVGHTAKLRSFFAADELGSLTLGGFRHVAGRSAPTLVCFPSVVSLAGKTEYKNFAAPFAGMRHVMQLDEIGCRDGEKLPEDLDALVAAHVEAVRRELLDSPVVLCGRSYGGWIAHATAARMAELGCPPAGVVLLDTFWPGEEFVRKFIPRTLRRVVEYQTTLGGTDLGLARLSAVSWYLRLLRNWEPATSTVPTLYVLPDDQTSIEQHLHSGGWRLPHTEVFVPADHLSFLNSDATVTAEAVEAWLSTLDRSEEGAG